MIEETSLDAMISLFQTLSKIFILNQIPIQLIVYGNDVLIPKYPK